MTEETKKLIKDWNVLKKKNINNISDEEWDKFRNEYIRLKELGIKLGIDIQATRLNSKANKK